MEHFHEPDEAERLRELKNYKIMDSGREACFDQLTFLASKICETPIAFLSFIDENRQWFKSCFGMEVQEIPRHISPCNHTIQHQHVHEIPDAMEADCPFQEYMKENGLRAYAGVPIVSPRGQHIGSLCVIDYEPRSLSNEQRSSLLAIAEEIVGHLEVRKNYQENLERLATLHRKYKIDNRDVLRFSSQRTHRVIAEFATGLDYRIRTLVNNSLSAEKILRYHSMSSSEQIAALDTIHNSMEMITSILQNLGKFVTAEKEKWMKPLDLISTVKDVLDHLEHKFSAKNIQLQTHLLEDVVIVGNYAKLCEAIFSLLSNSLEAIQNEKEGVIEVGVFTENKKAVILIKDNGVGIEESIAPYLFQPFYTTKTAPSLGVGLALAESHMEEHGGNIELISNRNPTIFKMSLPLP